METWQQTAYLTDVSFNTRSNSDEFIGDTVILKTPATGKHYIVKGILINGNGNQGSCRITGDSGRVLLTCDFSNSIKEGTGSNLNIVMNANEKITITTTGRGTNRTFVGLTMAEI